jgi:hypothetical protein
MTTRPGLANFFLRRVPKLSTNFEEIFSRAHAEFEEHNKILESSLLIIN